MRTRVVVAAALVLGAVLAWWLGGRRVGGSELGDVGRGGPSAQNRAATLAADGTPGLESRHRGVPEVTEGSLLVRFGHEARVRVVDRAGGGPIQGANVTAYFDATHAPAGYRGAEFYRTAETNAEGIVRLTNLPYGIRVTVRVGIEGYVVAEQTLAMPAKPAQSRDGTQPEHTTETHTIELTREMSMDEASTRVEVKWIGRPPTGDFRLIIDDPVIPSGVIRPGQAWLLDRDPNGPAERELGVRVVGRGFAGSWTKVTALRGQPVVVEVDAPQFIKIAFQVVDLAQKPIRDATVRVWPRTADAHRRALSTIEARTDPNGWAWARVEQDATLSVAVAADGVFFPRGTYFLKPQPAGSYLLQGSRLVQAAVTLVDGPTKASWGRVEWRAVEIDPGVASHLSRVASIQAFEELDAYYASELPKTLPILRPTSGSARLSIPCLPGRYRIRIHVGRFVSRETLLDVGPQGLATALRLEAQPEHQIVVKWKGGKGSWPLLHAAIFGHEAGWEERFALTDALGAEWVVNTRLLSGGRLDPKELRFAGDSLQARLPGLRDQGHAIPYDVAFLRADGTVRLQGPLPRAITIVRGDTSVAIVPAEPVQEGLAVVQLSEEDFGKLQVTVLDTHGDRVPDMQVFMGLANDLYRGRRHLSNYRKTDSSGVTSFGLAPQDTGALHVINARILDVHCIPDGLAQLETSMNGRRQYVLLRSRELATRPRLLLVVER